MSDVGEGRWRRGARLVTSAVLKPDPRPLHLILNGVAKTLAQSLFEYRAAHSPLEVAAFVAKLRVFDNQGQDEAGAWILHEFPDIHWIRGVAQTRAFGGPANNNLGPHVWKPYAYTPDGQDARPQEHIRTDHGAPRATPPPRAAGHTRHKRGGGRPRSRAASGRPPTSCAKGRASRTASCKNRPSSPGCTTAS